MKNAVFATGDKNPAALEPDDRRFLVVEPSAAEITAALMAYELMLHEATGDTRPPNLRDRMGAMRAALIAARGAK